MVKCVSCTRIVNKRSPGVQCSKCSRWFHGACVSLGNEQLAALSVTDSIDWKCKNCSAKGKPKRVSVIVPDQEEDDVDDCDVDATNENPILDLKNKMATEILTEIRREVREVVRQELQRSLSFYSEKIDDYEKKMQDFEEKVREMEKQCQDVRNNFKRATLIIDTLEQKLNNVEQGQLCNKLEICGVPETINEDLQKVASQVGVALKQNPNSIQRVYRKKKPTRGTMAGSPAAQAPAPIVVTLQDNARDNWLAAAKSTKITTKDLNMEQGSNVFVRETLSPTIAFLLWKAKNDLKNSSVCKFVWCKNGTILVRQTEEDKKVYTVRSVLDIDRILKAIKKT